MTTKKSTPQLQDMSAEIDALIADPRYADKVAAGLKRLAEIDKQHAMSLAAIRAAFSFTQTDIAKRLGVSQSSVAKLEARDDYLLSSLRSYLASIGGEIEIKVRFSGQPAISLALGALIDQSNPATPAPTPPTKRQATAKAKRPTSKKSQAKRRATAA